MGSTVNTWRLFNSERLECPSLLDAEMSLLSKDLNFCPTPNEVDEKTVRKDAEAFFRKLRLKE